MGIREDLIAAKALIDTPRKWRRGGSIQNGRSCAWNAVYDATRRHDRLCLAEVALAEAVPAERRQPSSQSTIIQFNDDPATTHADIMALFDRAISKAGATNA